MVKLNLGCGILVKKGLINVDVIDPELLKKHEGTWRNAVWEKGAVYVQADIRALPFKDNYADEVEMFETLEHIPFRQVVDTLKEIRRVMKRGAKLLVTVPNFDGLVKDWLTIMVSSFNLADYTKVIETIYGAQTANGQFHNGPFNPAYMNYCMVEAGFKKGNMFIVPKYGLLPKFGSSKWKKGTISRNETLYVEVEK